MSELVFLPMTKFFFLTRNINKTVFFEGILGHIYAYTGDVLLVKSLNSKRRISVKMVFFHINILF